MNSTKVCPRCWSDITTVLDNPMEYEEGKSLPTHEPLIDQSIDADQKDLDLELTQVSCNP